MSYVLYYPSETGWSYWSSGNGRARLKFTCTPKPDELKTHVKLEFQINATSGYTHYVDTVLTFGGVRRDISVTAGTVTMVSGSGWISSSYVLEYDAPHNADGTGSFQLKFENGGRGLGAYGVGVRYSGSRHDYRLLDATTVTMTLEKLILQNGDYDFQVFNGSWNVYDVNHRNSNGWRIVDPQINSGGWK